jgi:hypothetical protein
MVDFGRDRGRVAATATAAVAVAVAVAVTGGRGRAAGRLGPRAGSEGAVELPAVVDNRACRRAGHANVASLARLPTPP